MAAAAHFPVRDGVKISLDISRSIPYSHAQ